MGMDLHGKNIYHNNKNYYLQIWDISGLNQYRSLIPKLLKDVKCALIIIDVTNRTSFNDV